MNDARLSEIESRLMDATNGPWVYSPERHTHDCIIHQEGAPEDCGQIWIDNGGVIGSSEWIEIDKEDAVFIANAPTDIRDLISEIRRLKARLRED